MSGGSWPLPAGSFRPPRVGKTGRGRREGKLGPGVAPWGRAWRRGPAPGGAGEGGFPPGGGAGLASRAEAPGRGRSTPRPLGARWAGVRRFRGLARGAGTWGRPGTPSARLPTCLSAVRQVDIGWVCSEEAADAPHARTVFGRPSCTLNSRCSPSIQDSPECREGQGNASNSDSANHVGTAGYRSQPPYRCIPI